MNPQKDFACQLATCWNNNVSQQMHPLIIGAGILTTTGQEPLAHRPRILLVELQLHEAVERLQIKLLPMSLQCQFHNRPENSTLAIMNCERNAVKARRTRAHKPQTVSPRRGWPKGRCGASGPDRSKIRLNKKRQRNITTYCAGSGSGCKPHILQGNARPGEGKIPLCTLLQVHPKRF